jgi:hypothetical protein
MSRALALYTGGVAPGLKVSQQQTVHLVTLRLEPLARHAALTRRSDGQGTLSNGDAKGTTTKHLESAGGAAISLSSPTNLGQDDW